MHAAPENMLSEILENINYVMQVSDSIASFRLKPTI